MISIIIPTYNSSLVIGNLLNSILKTRLKDYEIIVVDDTSVDNTLDIARQYQQVKVIESKVHAGPARARNIGALQAKGDILVFIDSDVVLPDDSDVLLKMAEIFRTKKQVDCVSTISDVKPVIKNPIAYNTSIYHSYYMRKILAGSPSREGRIMFFTTRLGGIRVHRFRESGGFHESLYTAMNEDGEFGTRCYHLGYISYFSRELHHSHCYPTNIFKLFKSYFLTAFVQAIVDKKMDTTPDLSISPAEKWRRISAFLLLISPLVILFLDWRVWVWGFSIGLSLFIISFGAMNKLIWSFMPKKYFLGWYLVYFSVTPVILLGYFWGIIHYLAGGNLLQGVSSREAYFRLGRE